MVTALPQDQPLGSMKRLIAALGLYEGAAVQLRESGHWGTAA